MSSTAWRQTWKGRGLTARCRQLRHFLILKIIIVEMRLIKSGYVYLKEHSKKIVLPITPLKFEDPRFTHKDSPPKAPFVESKLKPEVIKAIYDKEFKNFKKSLITDPNKKQIPIVDPFQQRIKWYFQQPSKGEMFKTNKSFSQFRQRYEDHLVMFNIKLDKQLQHLGSIGAEQFTLGDYLVWITLAKKGQGVQKQWHQAESIINRQIKDLSTDQLIKIVYAANLASPKFLLYQTRLIINDLLFQSIPNLSLAQLIHAAHGLKNIKDLSRQKAMFDRMFQLASTDQELLNVLWTVSHCQYPIYSIIKRNRDVNQKRKQSRVLINRVIDRINIKNLSVDQMIKILLSLNKCQVSNYKPQLYQIEQHVLQNVDKLDAYQVAQLLYLSPRVQDGAGFGNTEFYTVLKNRAFEIWDQLNNLQKSRVLYTVYDFKLVDQKANELLFQLAQSCSQVLPYNQLKNVIMCLMMSFQLTPQWAAAFIENIINVGQNIPLIHFTQFKYFQIYCRHMCDNSELKMALLSADVRNDPGRLAPFASKDPQFLQISTQFLNANAQFIHFQPFKNTFAVDLVKPGKNVGFLIATDKFLCPGTDVTRASFDLKKALLQQQGFFTTTINIRQYYTLEKINRDYYYIDTLAQLEQQAQQYQQAQKSMRHQKLNEVEGEFMLQNFMPNDIEQLLKDKQQLTEQLNPQQKAFENKRKQQKQQKYNSLKQTYFASIRT